MAPDISKLSEMAQRPLSQVSFEEIDELILGMAEAAREEGTDTLDQIDFAAVEDKFLEDAIRVTVDQIAPDGIRTLLEAWLKSLLHEQETKYRKIMEGMISIRNGENPRLTQLRLHRIY